MFIANVPGNSQAPLGAACNDDWIPRRPMPLLTELERTPLGTLSINMALLTELFVSNS